MIIDCPWTFGGWTPVAPPVDLSTPPHNPAAAAVIRRANSRTDHARQEIAGLRSALDSDAEQAAVIEREREALLAEHRRRFPWF